MHLFKRNRGFIGFDILGFNYEFNALDPMGKPNELHEAFESFKVKYNFTWVVLFAAMFPALGPILKIFVNFPFLLLDNEPKTYRPINSRRVNPGAGQLSLGRPLTALRIKF